MTDVSLLETVPHDRLASLLACGVSAALAGQLAQSPRFRNRVAGLISSRLGDIGDLNREQARALAMQPRELTDLAFRAGVVWHAGVIVRVIDRVARELLIARLGERNYELAIACIGWQPRVALPDRAPEDIAKAIPIDGAACLAAWCESQPRAVSGRLRLIRPSASPELAHETWGAQIVARLLADQ